MSEPSAVEKLLAEHAPTYTEYATDPTTTFYCKSCSDAAGDWVTWTPAHLAEVLRGDGLVERVAEAIAVSYPPTRLERALARAALAAIFGSSE